MLFLKLEPEAGWMVEVAIPLHKRCTIRQDAARIRGSHGANYGGSSNV